MSFRSRLVFALTLGLLTLGPALALPSLSAHTPTLSAPAQPAPHGPLDSPFAPAAPLLGMAIRVKDASTVAAKWKTRAGNSQADYVAGAVAAAGDFESKALASEDNYKAAVVDAASKGLYGRGVRGSGAKYLKNVQNVGGARFQQGVNNAQDAMAAGIAPILQVISGLTLPPRGVKGTNQNRSDIVATALRKHKVGS